MVSYKTALPDSGVDALRQQHITDVNDLTNRIDSLTGRINALQTRVVALEQSGDMSITSVVVDGVGRTVTVEGSTADHADNATVSITITDDENRQVTATANLSGTAPSHTFSEVINTSTLTSGTLTIRATSVDTFGRSYEVTETRAYNVQSSGLVLVSSLVNATMQTLNVEVTANLQYPTPADNVTGLQLVVTDSIGTTLTFSPSSTVSATKRALWTDLDISTLATGNISYEITGTDFFGTDVKLESGAISFDPANAGFVKVDGYIETNPNRHVALHGTVHDASVSDTLNVSITDGVDTVTGTATVYGDWNPVATEPHQQLSYAKQWRTANIDLSTLDKGNLTVTVTGTDNTNRALTDVHNYSYAPYAGMNIAATVNDVAKTIRVNGGTKYVNGNVSLSITSSGGGTAVTATATPDAVGYFITTDIDISSLGFGTITVDATVSSDGGPITDDFTTTFADVSGTIAITTVTIDDAADSVVVEFNEDNSNVEHLLITDTDGTEINVPVGASDTSKTVDISTLKYGTLTFKITGTDAGSSAVSHTRTATYTDVSGSISVSQFMVTTNPAEANIRVSVTNVNVGTTVNWEMMDVNGLKVTGSYAYADGATEKVGLGAMVYGHISLTVKTTDIKGQEVTNVGNSTYSAPGTITAGIAINDSTKVAVVSGTTTSVNSGATVTITIADVLAATVVGSTTVSGGNWTADLDVSSLSYGPLTAHVSVTDVYGLTATDQALDGFDPVNGSVNLLVDIDSDTGLAWVRGSVTNGKAAAPITVTMSDANGGTADVIRSMNLDVGGNFDFGNVSIASQDYGSINFNASVEDLSGATVTADVSANYNAPIGTVTATQFTVDNAAATFTVRGTSTDIPNGTEGTLRVSSDGGAGTHLRKTNVQANGSWEIVDSPMSVLPDGTLSAYFEVTDVGGVLRTSNTLNAVRDTAGAVLTSNIDVTYPAAGTSDTAATTAATYLNVNGTFDDIPNGTNVDVKLGPLGDGSFTNLTDTVSGGPGSPAFDILVSDISAYVDRAITAEVSVVDRSFKTRKLTSSPVTIRTPGHIRLDSFTNDPDNKTVSIGFTTTNIDMDNTVQIKVTDINNATVEWQIINDSSTETITNHPITALAYGNLDISVKVPDRNGTMIEVALSDFDYPEPAVPGGITMTTAKALESSSPAMVFAGTTTNIPEGTTVNIEIKKGVLTAEGYQTTVQANGSWSWTNGSNMLVEGEHTAVAKVIDQTGTERTDSRVFTSVLGSGGEEGPV